MYDDDLLVRMNSVVIVTRCLHCESKNATLTMAIKLPILDGLAKTDKFRTKCI